MDVKLVGNGTGTAIAGASGKERRRVRISVVIPTFNGREVVLACLAALAEQTRQPDEIIVIDDGSTDGSVDAIAAQHLPGLRVHAMLGNRGFCAAANHGLTLASGDLVALLNNDTEPTPSWLAALEEAALAAPPNVGAFACKMLFKGRPRVINSAGLLLRTDGAARDIGFEEPDGPEFARTREVFGASGGAALFRRTMLADVGLFDERLGAYYEDVDLAMRAQLRGWRCLFIPEAVVYHHMGASYGQQSPQKTYLTSRNAVSVTLKTFPTALLAGHWPRLLAFHAYQIAYHTRHGRGWSALHGKVAALSGLAQTLVDRTRIQRAATVPPERIAALFTARRDRGWSNDVERADVHGHQPSRVA